MILRKQSVANDWYPLIDDFCRQLEVCDTLSNLSSFSLKITGNYKLSETFSWFLLFKIIGVSADTPDTQKLSKTARDQATMFKS